MRFHYGPRYTNKTSYLQKIDIYDDNLYYSIFFNVLEGDFSSSVTKLAGILLYDKIVCDTT